MSQGQGKYESEDHVWGQVQDMVREKLFLE